jgi:UDPglucose 6-dehydrogenase
VKERDYKITKLTEDFNKAVTGADVLMFATNHKEYYEIDLDDLKKRVRTPIIIDGRNIFDKKIVEEKGFIYRKVGEGPLTP